MGWWACSAGSQRFAAHWTGDNLSSWEHYRMNFPMVINMALSGYAIAGKTCVIRLSYPHALLHRVSRSP